MNAKELRNAFDQIDVAEQEQIIRILERFLSLSPEKQAEALKCAEEITNAPERDARED